MPETAPDRANIQTARHTGSLSQVAPCGSVECYMALPVILSTVRSCHSPVNNERQGYQMFSLSLKQASQWSTLALLLVLAGCANVPERQPLPAEHILKAGIPGIPDARF